MGVDEFGTKWVSTTSVTSFLSIICNKKANLKYSSMATQLGAFFPMGYSVLLTYI